MKGGIAFRDMISEREHSTNPFVLRKLARYFPTLVEAGDEAASWVAWKAEVYKIAWRILTPAELRVLVAHFEEPGLRSAELAKVLQRGRNCINNLEHSLVGKFASLLKGSKPVMVAGSPTGTSPVIITSRTVMPGASVAGDTAEG